MIKVYIYSYILFHDEEQHNTFNESELPGYNSDGSPSILLTSTVASYASSNGFV